VVLGLIAMGVTMAIDYRRIRDAWPLVYLAVLPLLVGVVVATRLGVQATAFYLAVYAVMNLASFAVVVARERETGRKVVG